MGCKVAQVAAVSTALRTTINNYFREFNTFLENVNDICYHHGNIQTDLIEVFKMNNKLFLWKVEIDTFNVSKFHKLVTDRKRKVPNGPGTFSNWYIQLSKAWTLSAFSKKELDIGHAVTVYAGYEGVMFKIPNF